MENEYVSIREAAKATGLSEYTVRKMHERGEIISFPKYIPGQTNYKAHINLAALREYIGMPAAGNTENNMKEV